VEEASTTHDWVVWCISKKGAKEICSFELSWKVVFFNHSETTQEWRNCIPNATNFSFAGLLVLLQYYSYGKRDFIYITGTDKSVYPITLQIGSKKYPEKVLMFSLSLR